MDIQKRDPAGKGEGGTGRGDNVDLARQPAVGARSGKAHVHQRSGPDIFKGRGSLSVADARFRVNGKAHGNGVDGVTQGELVVLEVDGDNLAVGVCRGRGHANADVAGKNIVPIVIQLGVNVNALAFFQRQLRGFRAVMEDMRALIKVDAPAAAAEDVHG